MKRTVERAIVIGATSGIGRALAVLLHREGATVGITGRRETLLDELSAELRSRVHARRMDLAASDEARSQFASLVGEMGGVDLVVISSGTGHLERELDWALEDETIAVNVRGFAAVATAAIEHFAAAGGGHLVGISSLAARRGGGGAPAYHATKAFVSNYLQGLRYNVQSRGLDVVVTDVQPGLVETAMVKSDAEHRPRGTSPEKAAAGILAAVRRRRKLAVVPASWRFAAFVLVRLPDPLYRRLF